LKRFIGIGALRLCNGFAQFGVILFVTKALSVADLGTYALVAILLGYFSQGAGFTFYSYVSRELARFDRAQWPSLLFQHWLFMLAGIAGAAVIAALLFHSSLIVLDHGGMFVALLALTVINNQHENFLVSTGHPVHASINLCARGLWILPLASAHFLWDVPVGIRGVLLSWIGAEALAAGFVLFQAKRLGLLPERVYPINLDWIFRGIKVGGSYTCLSLLLLLTISVQRVVLKHVQGDEGVGIFHFYHSIAVFIPNLLEATLFAIILPKLIAAGAAQNEGEPGFPPLRQFGILLGVGGAGLFVVFLCLPYALDVLQRAVLKENRHLFLFTAGFALLYSASRIFHYQLYSRHKDRYLIQGNIAACAVACITAIVLIPRYGLEGAGVSALLTGLAMMIALGWPCRPRSVRA
jgi:O-antigen/teichoic acid export membrane protein